jgi:hypothetical protein
MHSISLHLCTFFYYICFIHLNLPNMRSPIQIYFWHFLVGVSFTFGQALHAQVQNRCVWRFTPTSTLFFPRFSLPSQFIYWQAGIVAEIAKKAMRDTSRQPAPLFHRFSLPYQFIDAHHICLYTFFALSSSLYILSLFDRIQSHISFVTLFVLFTPSCFFFMTTKCQTWHSFYFPLFPTFSLFEDAFNLTSFLRFYLLYYIFYTSSFFYWQARLEAKI